MANIDPLVNEIGTEIGSGGMVVLTGSIGALSMRQILIDIADDLEAINTAGAYGLTLEHTAEGVNEAFGEAGAFMVPGGGDPADLLNEMFLEIARDLAAIKTAGGITWTLGHTEAKMPADFLHGGRHMVPNRDSFLGSTPHEWIGEPLYLAALDIVKVNDSGNGGPDATIKTSVTERP